VFSIQPVEPTGILLVELQGGLPSRPGYLGGLSGSRGYLEGFLLNQEQPAVEIARRLDRQSYPKENYQRLTEDQLGR
jgi:hypothetical protein